MCTLPPIVYSPEYEVNLGSHPFVTSKFRLIKEKLIKEGLCSEENFFTQVQASKEDILLVHTEQYYNKVTSLSLSYEEILQLEIPLTEEIVRASIICCAGTILCCKLAIQHSVGIHLGGGFHHAFPDHGEGFCIFNDLAVAVKKLLKEKEISRPLIVDCDLHQGNGTAYIFRDDPSVFTFSIHQSDIYPFPKQKSTLDVELPPGTSDETYNSLLEENLKKAFNKHQPDFVLYQAGADPYSGDQLGNLNLSITGLKKRDEIVHEFCKFHNLPVAVTLGGGYALNTDDTVAIHFNTVVSFLQTSK